MRKVIIMFALAMGIASAHAQENVTVETTNGSNEQPTLTKEVYPQKEADGDLYHGLSRKLTFDRMIPPHGLEVTYDKTVHVIFPAEVRYVDLGSPDLIAGKADAVRWWSARARYRNGSTSRLPRWKYDGTIIPVELAVYDTDGQPGIFIPNSMEMNAVREVAANMGGSLGSSINISTNAGAQLASDLGKGLIQGTSQYIAKKMRTVKVHLKAGYRVMLYQEKY